ncbi:MAG: GGDEF domain-containing protein [Alphaproteobacteria bacterium]
MPNTDVAESPAKLANTAIVRMAKLKIPPTPENFTVWYSYLRGDDPDVVHMIDRYLDSGEPFTEERCNALHLRCSAFAAKLIEEEGEATLLNAGSSLGKSVETVMSLLDEAGAGAARYGEALAGVDGALEGVEGGDRVRQIVSDLVAETHLVVQQNQNVNERLEQSNQEIAELQKRISDARREAMSDSLTGLNNRRAFDEHLRKGVADAEANNTPLSLLMLDIDHFKAFNDTHGHQLGDEVLRLVARCLVDCTKGRDTAARYGGEEFAIILPDTDMEGAIALAEQVRETVNSKKIVRKSTGESLGGVTLSGGAAVYMDGDLLEDFIERADAGLYKAKGEGRNRIAVIEALQGLRVVGGQDLA